MYREFITPAGIANLRKHKYVSGAITPLDRYVMEPFWDRMTQLLPLWLAPNLVTLIGFVILNSAVWIMFATMDFESFEVTSGSIIFAVIAKFVYQTLDGMDGKQARRLGKSSPLGQLFDHGCDCILTTFWPFTIMMAIGVRNDPLEMFLFTCGPMVIFFAPHFAEYFTHILITSIGVLGVSEAQFVLMTLTLLGGILGTDYLSPIIPFTCPLISHLSQTLLSLLGHFFGNLQLDLHLPPDLPPGPRQKTVLGQPLSFPRAPDPDRSPLHV